MEVTPKDMQDLVLEGARLREERDARDAQIEALRKERAELVALWGKMREAYDNSRWCDMRDGKCATLGGCSRCLTAERDALRLRVAEVERERDEALTQLDASGEGHALLRSERDDARRVAKSLALYREHALRGTLEKWDADQRTAIAYEVEP